MLLRQCIPKYTFSFSFPTLYRDCNTYTNNVFIPSPTGILNLMFFKELGVFRNDLKDMRYDLWVDEWRWGLSSLGFLLLWKLATEVIVFTNVYFGRVRRERK